MMETSRTTAIYAVFGLEVVHFRTRSLRTNELFLSQCSRGLLL